MAVKIRASIAIRTSLQLPAVLLHVVRGNEAQKIYIFIRVELGHLFVAAARRTLTRVSESFKGNERT